MPFAFDCQNETRARAMGAHVGVSTTPVSTCPVPIFARNGGDRSGPPPKFDVGVHRAAGPAAAAVRAAVEEIAATRSARRIRPKGYDGRTGQRNVSLLKGARAHGILGEGTASGGSGRR